MNNHKDIGRGLISAMYFKPNEDSSIDPDARFRAWVATEKVIFDKAREQEAKILADAPSPSRQR
jgi:hypothetical protein